MKWYSASNMLDIQFVIDNKDLVRKNISNRCSEEVDLDEVELLYTKRTELVGEIDDINRQKKEVAQTRDYEKGRTLREKGQKKEAEFSKIAKELSHLLAKIPNMPLADVPIGKDESENVVIRTVGEKTKFSFDPKPHWDLGRDLDVIDIERATKVSGARFVYIKGDLAVLQVALYQFVLSVVTDKSSLESIAKSAGLQISTKPFVPVIPPTMIKPEMMFGMARLEPKEDKFFIEKDELFMVGSAEHTLGAMHAGEMFEEKDLPFRYLGISPAFRREAGSYGKDTKGILRQHQFDKLEFESFTLPEDSRKEQDFLIAIQEYLMQQLGLPYQVVAVCTGDMGGPDLRQIDIETHMPGQGMYRETHSADLVGEYQSRRLGIKVKRSNGEKEFVHMNDATVIAIGRIFIAILENFQQEDGSILLPEVLRKFSGIDRITKK